MTIGGTAGIQLLNIDGSPVTQDQLDRINEATISHHNLRKKLWCDVIVAICNSAVDTPRSNAIESADAFLKEFDERFGK